MFKKTFIRAVVLVFATTTAFFVVATSYLFSFCTSNKTAKQGSIINQILVFFKELWVVTKFNYLKCIDLAFKFNSNRAMQPSDKNSGLFFLHGFYGNDYLFRSLESSITQQNLDLDLHYIPNIYFHSSIEEQSKRIAKYLEQFNYDKVFLVGHSMGGVICNFIVSFLPKAGVEYTVVSICSPFNGTTMANFSPLLSTRDLRPGSELLTKLNKSIEENNNVNRLFVASDQDHVIYPWDSAILRNSGTSLIFSTGHNSILFEPELVKEVTSYIKLA